MNVRGKVTLASMLMWAAIGTVSADNGLVTKPSAHSSAVTLDRLEAALKKKGFIIFARLDHAAAAASLDLKMPASTVLVFGNPRNGTPAMQKKPTLAIDLPLKALVWEDAAGKVSVSYNTGAYIQGTVFPRHGLPTNAERQKAIDGVLAAVTDAAVN
jgi:uncharacterized protein (DUF302 family)